MLTIFSDFVIKSLEHFKINNHPINLEKDKQLSYKPIYNLKLLKFKIPKIYIKIKFASNFIRLLKLVVNALILFDFKKDNSL